MVGASKPTAVVDPDIAASSKKLLDVYSPNPFLDTSLTVLYIGLSAWTVYAAVYDEEPRMFKVMLVSLVVVALFAELNKLVFNWLGKYISRTFYQAGCVNTDIMNDVNSPQRLRKWNSQAWQLAIHSSMTCCELYFLAQFPHWWTDPASLWLESTREVEVDIWLKSFYILQQVSHLVARFPHHSKQLLPFLAVDLDVYMLCACCH
jgi:hypothetical protein